jgi:hypothetical protein
MEDPNLSQPSIKRKLCSIGAQIDAIKLVRKADFRKAFPGMRESEVIRTKEALLDAALTLSQLTER